MQHQTDIANYIDRLKKLLSVKSDQQLADEIGVAKQTISSWRKRGKLPLSVEEELSDRYGPEAAFSNFLRYASDRREDFVVCALYFVIRKHFAPRLPNAIGTVAELCWSQALIYSEPAIRRIIREIGFEYMSREEVYGIVASRIEKDEIEQVVRGLDVYVRPRFHPELEKWMPDDSIGMDQG